MTKITNNISCDYFNKSKCKSCTLLGKDIKLGNKDKIERAIQLLDKQTTSKTKIRNVYSLDEPFHSRARARLSVSGTVEKPIIGLLDKQFQGIELTSCPLHFEIINKLINFLPTIISKYGLSPYDIKAKKGELKSLIVQSNSSSKELMLRFIVRSTKSIERIKKAVPELKKAIPELKVISTNIQSIPHQIPEGPEEHILTEQKTINEKYADINFLIAPQCFSQVTPRVAEKLYLYVAKIVSKIKPETVLDLFCGIGGFSLFSSKYVTEVFAVEISKQAIECAKLAATKNKMNNITFYSDDVEKKISQFKQKKSMLVICNPPRRGLGENINSLNKLAPETIIYSSCNPSSLAKDISRLNDYELTEIAPFDMFPLTEHLEIVVTMRRSAKNA